MTNSLARIVHTVRPASRRWLVRYTALLVVVLGPLPAHSAEPPPNLVLILCDNLGYGDIGCFGGTAQRTPHLDRLAAGGRRFTHYYSASGVCSPSRAALMTGCYPLRVGLDRGTTGLVLRPLDPLGISADETTLAELFSAAGYATAAIGKWHLGDQPPFLPTRHGFDRYFGIPYSEDMVGGKFPGWPPLPLMRDERVVEAPADRDTLTARYTAEAVQFITDHRDRPFFLYFPHAVPGSEPTSFASPPFQGHSANGRYGDAVEEMDWSVGQITATLKKLGIERRTLVVWTSDNGAVRREPRQGSNLPLGGWGYTTSEGAMRVPLIAAWPGRIPAGTECAELCTMMDWVPTAAGLLGRSPPADKPIDGHDIRPLLFAEPDARTPYRSFYYYRMNQLQAVRSGPWKWFMPLSKQPTGRNDVIVRPALFDVVADPGETTNVMAKHPDVVARLEKIAEQARVDLGDVERPGRRVRPPGRVDKPVPQVMP